MGSNSLQDCTKLHAQIYFEWISFKYSLQEKRGVCKENYFRIAHTDHVIGNISVATDFCCTSTLKYILSSIVSHQKSKDWYTTWASTGCTSNLLFSTLMLSYVSSLQFSIKPGFINMGKIKDFLFSDLLDRLKH